MTDAQREQLRQRMAAYIASAGFEKDLGKHTFRSLPILRLIFGYLFFFPIGIRHTFVLISRLEERRRILDGFRKMAPFGRVINLIPVVQNVHQLLSGNACILSLVLGNFNDGKDDRALVRLGEELGAISEDPSSTSPLKPYLNDLLYKTGRRRKLPPHLIRGLSATLFDFRVFSAWWQFPVHPFVLGFGMPGETGEVLMIPLPIVLEVIPEYQTKKFGSELTRPPSFPPIPGSASEPRTAGSFPSFPPIPPTAVTLGISVASLASRFGPDFHIVSDGPQLGNTAFLNHFCEIDSLRLPDDFRAFHEEVGAVLIAADENIWPYPQPKEIRPFWAFCNCLLVYGTGINVPPEFNMIQAALDFKKNYELEFYPFIRGRGLDAYLFDREGKIYRWDYECREAEPLDKTFLQIFEEECNLLKSRMQKIKNGEGGAFKVP